MRLSVTISFSDKEVRNMKDATPAELFAALKLIEQLYKDGHIPQYIFKNILNEYIIFEFCIAVCRLTDLFTGFGTLLFFNKISYKFTQYLRHS